MTLDEKLRELEAARDRYVAAVNAMTSAIAAGEPLDVCARLMEEVTASGLAGSELMERYCVP